jgi:hypothetical protein
MCNIAGENLVVAASDLFGKHTGLPQGSAQELFRLMGRRCGLAGGRANNCGSTMETWRESGKGVSRVWESFCLARYRR